MGKVFKDKLASAPWQDKLRQIVPSYGTRLNEHPEQVMQEWRYTSEVLQLTPPPAIDPAQPVNPPTHIDAVQQKHLDSDPDLKP